MLLSTNKSAVLAALALCSPLVLGSPVQCPVNSLTVSTSSGTVAGAINGTAPGVRQFLGIPFAQQPLGDLRWMPPMPMNESTSIIDATQFSPSCPQYEGASLSAYNQDVRELLINGPTGENCLTLSIWAPAYPTGSSLPVYIWIYGGGFQTGGSSVPYQNPAQWVQRTQSHIVVSIQYRLNIFGFPNAAGLTSQNLGFLDQRLAIEWTQSNIAAFGGDPSKMVMWGQSAGAQSVDIQNFAYPDDPIVSGFVCDSGSVYLNSLYSEDFQHTNFSSVASHFNCSGSAATELSCMRNVSSMDIEAYLKSYSDSGTTPSLAFDPFPDDIIVFSNYTQQYLSGHLSTAPAIFGTNLNEGTSLVTYPNHPATMAPNQTAVEETILGTFLCPAAMSSKMRQLTNRTTYRYQYRGNFTNISPRWWLGAYHSSELPMIFGTDGDFRGMATGFEMEISSAMQDLWLAFAEDPTKGVEGMGWESYDKGVVEVFAGDGRVRQLLPVDSIDDVCGS